MAAFQDTVATSGSTKIITAGLSFVSTRNAFTLHARGCLVATSGIVVASIKLVFPALAARLCRKFAIEITLEASFAVPNRGFTLVRDVRGIVGFKAAANLGFFSARAALSTVTHGLVTAFLVGSALGSNLAVFVSVAAIVLVAQGEIPLKQERFRQVAMDRRQNTSRFIGVKKRRAKKGHDDKDRAQDAQTEPALRLLRSDEVPFVLLEVLFVSFDERKESNSKVVRCQDSDLHQKIRLLSFERLTR